LQKRSTLSQEQVLEGFKSLKFSNTKLEKENIIIIITIIMLLLNPNFNDDGQD